MDGAGEGAEAAASALRACLLLFLSPVSDAVDGSLGASSSTGLGVGENMGVYPRSVYGFHLVVVSIVSCGRLAVDFGT